MKLVEWVKWRVAPREMEELERWRIQWEEHRRWFAEFPIAAVTLDHLKAKVEREPVTSIHVVRDSCRSADVKQVRQNHTTPPQQQAEPVSHAVIVGALFDFMGWLTTRKERLILSSTDNASPAADAIKVFAEMRGLSLDDALVQDWQNYTTPQKRQWVGLTDEEIDAIDEANWDADDKSWGIHSFARAIETKLKEKNDN